MIKKIMVNWLILLMIVGGGLGLVVAKYKIGVGNELREQELASQEGLGAKVTQVPNSPLQESRPVRTNDDTGKITSDEEAQESIRYMEVLMEDSAIELESLE